MADQPPFFVVDDDEQGAARAAGLGPAHILVIDDEPDMLGLYKACLTPAGYRVTAASDGLAGVDLAAVDPPAAIILDMLMPGMSGLEVCDRLRAAPATADVPILMVSGRDAAGDRVTCLRHGVDDFITKPFEYEELVARVEALLRRAGRSAGGAVRQVSPDDRRRLQILRRALAEGPECLLPRYTTRTACGFVYPVAGEPREKDPDPVADLEHLHANGYLERSFHDTVLVCPFCAHHDLHLREVCPACGSSDLRPVEMIHHYRCAFVGPAAAFRKADRLVCPKCRGVLRHIGLEYEKPTDTVQCGGCDRGFQEPDVAARCRRCGRPFPPEQAERKRIHSYALTAAGRFVAEVGSFLTAPGGPDFVEQGMDVYRPEFFRELVGHEVGRGAALGHPTALLKIGVRGLEKVVEHRGEAAGRQALHEVVRNIRNVARRVDKVARVRPVEFVVLLPGGDTRAAVTLARRLAEAVDRDRSEVLEKVGLNYAWAVHPHEAADAERLLNRVMEQVPTAYLGDPEAYAAGPRPLLAPAAPARDQAEDCLVDEEFASLISPELRPDRAKGTDPC